MAEEQTGFVEFRTTDGRWICLPHAVIGCVVADDHAAVYLRTETVYGDQDEEVTDNPEFLTLFDVSKKEAERVIRQIMAIPHDSERKRSIRLEQS